MRSHIFGLYVFIVLPKRITACDVLDIYPHVQSQTYIGMCRRFALGHAKRVVAKRVQVLLAACSSSYRKNNDKPFHVPFSVHRHQKRKITLTSVCLENCLSCHYFNGQAQSSKSVKRKSEVVEKRRTRKHLSPLRKQSKRLSLLRSIAKHFVAFLMRKRSRRKAQSAKASVYRNRYSKTHLVPKTVHKITLMYRKRDAKKPPCTVFGTQNRHFMHRFRYIKRRLEQQNAQQHRRKRTINESKSRRKITVNVKQKNVIKYDKQKQISS